MVNTLRGQLAVLSENTNVRAQEERWSNGKGNIIQFINVTEMRFFGVLLGRFCLFCTDFGRSVCSQLMEMEILLTI